MAPQAHLCSCLSLKLHQISSVVFFLKASKHIHMCTHITSGKFDYALLLTKIFSIKDWREDHDKQQVPTEHFWGIICGCICPQMHLISNVQQSRSIPEQLIILIPISVASSNREFNLPQHSPFNSLVSSGAHTVMNNTYQKTTS